MCIMNLFPTIIGLKKKKRKKDRKKEVEGKREREKESGKKWNVELDVFKFAQWFADDLNVIFSTRHYQHVYMYDALRGGYDLNAMIYGAKIH